MHSLDIFYFGDQSVEPCDSVLQLVAESRGSPSLTQFLVSSFSRLRSRVTQFYPSEQEIFRADSFEALAQSRRDRKSPHVAVITVLGCVAQLGWAIQYEMCVTQFVGPANSLQQTSGKEPSAVVNQRKPGDRRSL